MERNKKYLSLYNNSYAMYIDFSNYNQEGIGFILGIEYSATTWHHNREIKFVAEDSFYIYKENLDELLKQMEKQMKSGIFKLKITDNQGDTESTIIFNGKEKEFTISGQLGSKYAPEEPVTKFSFKADPLVIKSFYNILKEINI